MHRRSTWIWGGRVVALVVVAALTGYLWTVGLDRAGQVASVLTLLVAVVALVAPYLFPLCQPSGAAAPTLTAPETTQSLADTVASRHPSLAVDAEDIQAPAMATPVTSEHLRQTGRAARKADWIVAIMSIADIEDPEFRRTVLRAMGDLLELGHAFSVPYRSMARDHVVELVERCWDFRDPTAARRALASALTLLRPDDRAIDKLERVLKDS